VISNLRVRLTAIYGGIFVVFVALLLGISYGLMARHLDRTLDPLSNTVRMTVMTLRRKLGDPPIIQTVRGSGYRV
jgi:hypothetical protein